MIDQQDKDTLRKVLEISQKNSRMLHSIERSMFWGRIFRIVYWVIIIGAAIGAFYYIQPYIDEVLAIYENLKLQVGGIFGN